MAPDTTSLVAAILNDFWMARHYERGAGMLPTSRLAMQRAQAIQRLGLTVRHAFTVSDDFEALLKALVDGGCPRHDEHRF